jgi:hypothetical protein
VTSSVTVLSTLSYVLILYHISSVVETITWDTVKLNGVAKNSHFLPKWKVDILMCRPYPTIHHVMKYQILTPFSVAAFASVFADIVLKVRQPMINEVGQFRDGGTLISFLYPGQNKDLVDQLLAKKLTAFGKLINALFNICFLRYNQQ